MVTAAEHLAILEDQLRQTQEALRRLLVACVAPNTLDDFGFWDRLQESDINELSRAMLHARGVIALLPAVPVQGEK